MKNLNNILKDFTLSGYLVEKQMIDVNGIAPMDADASKRFFKMEYGCPVYKHKVVLNLYKTKFDIMLIVKYIKIDHDAQQTIYKDKKTIYLDDFGNNWDFVNDDVQDIVDKFEENANNADDDIENAHADDADDVEDTAEETYCTDATDVYSESDAILLAKLMNDFGLSFVRTLEKETEDLRLKPPFTADDALAWLDTAYDILQQRYENNNFDDYTEYVNGPIHMKKYKEGCTEFNIVLVDKCILPQK